MHAVEAVDEAKAGGGGCGGGSGGGAGQKQGAAAARLRSALEDRVIKLEAARYEERAAVDFFNTAMRVDKCYHLLHDEGMYPWLRQGRPLVATAAAIAFRAFARATLWTGTPPTARLRKCLRTACTEGLH